MKDYQYFSVKDLVLDEDFQSWVHRPTDESDLFWKKFLSRHPDKAIAVAEASDLVMQLNMPGYSFSQDEETALWHRIHQGGQPEMPVFSRTVHRYWWYRAASVVAILCALSFFFFLKGNKIIVETAYGETRMVVLPDSSTVMLNANSKISYAGKWDNESMREIKLDGEAYFEVRHKENNQPFKVTVADGVAVEVLGTSFDLYHRTAKTKVVLSSGAIRLSISSKTKKQGQILMKPGDLVEVKGGRYDQRKVDANLYVAWTKNKLVLDRTSLREIIQMLKDNYGIDVQASDPALLDETVSGSMPMPDKANSVEQIAKAFRLTVTKENNTYVLKE